MTPTAVAKSTGAGRRGSTTRYSILSDPRLSQLFALSSQLEALAQSIDVQPPQASTSKMAKKQQCQELQQQPPPELPPKQCSNNNNNLQDTFKYRRLEDPVDELENIALISSMTESEDCEERLINMAPPPRYSTISDSHMSTSSQGAESTPSANSVLSESSLVLQSGDILPEALEASSGKTIDEKKTIQPPPTSEAEWQARCIELEMALQKFRDQAHNIRKLLRDKLSELEQRVIEAETRAEDAEGKVRLMERRLNEVEWSHPTSNQQRSNASTTTSAAGSTSNLFSANNEAAEAELSVAEKDRIIRTLESEVEAQRALRLADAKAVEAKAARIKDWVTNKLRELEDQNAHLKVQNAKANDQMELLRTRLDQLQALSATTKSRQSSMAEQDSSLGSFEGDPVASEESLTDVVARSSNKSKRAETQAGGCSTAGKDSLQSGLETPTPTRRRLPASSNGGTNKIRDSRVDSGSVDLETPLEMSPKSPLEVLDEALSSVMRNASPVAPPRTRNLSNSRPSKGRSESDCEPLVTAALSAASKLQQPQLDLPERHKSLQMPLAPLPITKKLSSTAKKAHLMMSDEVHDYSEIYTPSAEQNVMLDDQRSSMSQESSLEARTDSGLSVQAQPPPPPLHRYPSWENRIYQVASEGMKDATGDMIDSKNNNGLHRGVYGSDINVPVYATVKGRASQIRSVPFTGDSSDSDSDCGGVAELGHHHQAASVGGHHHLRHPSEEGVFRDTSFESDLSTDYAIPPDASSSAALLAPLPSTPSRILMSQDSPARKAGACLNNVEKTLEKSGYLTKLGGKIKSWRKRYFVLKNGTLSYWKSQHDVHRKPQGLIILDEKCRVSRADGANTFEIATENKTYYLTADSQPLMEDWVRVLQNVVQRNALKLLLSREDGISPTLQGWLLKVKHGHSKRVWCVLIGKMFVYFKCPSDSNPAGQINMRDTRVEEVEHISSDSDSDETAGEKQTEPTVGIFPNHVQQGPTYLIFNNKAEQEQWLYHLTVVSGGDPKAGTQFEQLIQKLMEEDGSPLSAVWRHPAMTYSKDPITSPLTTFTSEEIQAEALKLFKSLLLFTNVIMDSAGIDYHVMLAGNVFQQCLDNPGLQQELLCALCKQTSRIMTQSSKHGVQSFLMNATQLFTCDGATKSPPGSGPTQSQSSVQSKDQDKANPATHVFIQGWMLMSLAVSIFVPKSSKLLWFLRNHFSRNKDSKTECGKYAAYCARALERTVSNGPRQAKPSRMEVLSILLKNPHHHSLPHAMPVHFANETYQVVGFDGSSTIAEFLQDLNQELGCRPVDQSGFTIFSDDPLDKDLYHALHLQDKVCDVISKWETALREKGMGKFENKRVIRFVYQNRLFWRKNVVGEVDKERLLFVYQISKQIVQERFPLNKELAFELCALMAQIHFGDLNLPEKTSSSSSSGVSSGGSLQAGAQKQCASEALDKFFPPRYMETHDLDSADQSVLESCLIEKWASLRGKSMHDCVRIYLNCTRKWQFFGAQLFNVHMVNDRQCSPLSSNEDHDQDETTWLAVNEDGVSLLDQHSMQLLARYSYDNVVTFGGCQDDFMLVVTSDTSSSSTEHNSKARYTTSHHSDRASSEDSAGTTKLLFNAGKPQILQITLLMADYMNMIGKTAPGTLSSCTATPLATPKNRACSRSSSRAGRGLLTAPNTPRPDHKELTPRLSGVLSNTCLQAPSTDGSRRKWSHLD